MITLAREACLIQTCVPINETQRLVSATKRRPANSSDAETFEVFSSEK